MTDTNSTQQPQPEREGVETPQPTPAGDTPAGGDRDRNK